LFLLAENVEDLVYRVRLLLRVRLLALVGIRILLPQQVPKNVDDYVPHLLQIWNQLARLVGANADQRVTVAVETEDPKKMKLFRRFIWESRGVEEQDFEQVWTLLAKLSKPLGVVDASCFPPVQDKKEEPN
jgi:hypothetical protein